jgi:TrmH family RNA methyltransferase
MISKSQISLIRSFEHKKYRDINKLFVAEGLKVVSEAILAQWPIETLFASEDGLTKLKEQVGDLLIEPIICKPNELARISRLKTPPEVIAILHHQTHEIDYLTLKNELVLALDYIQDPGNLGTIIRICNWFGIKHLICSEGSADLFNPKVIQASMGGFVQGNTYYTDLEIFVADYKKHTSNPIYGTFLEGEDFRTSNKNQKALIVMGNEGKGIRPEIEKLIDHKIVIPAYSPETAHIDSLNISVATAIIVSAFRQ